MNTFSRIAMTILVPLAAGLTGCDDNVSPDMVNQAVQNAGSAAKQIISQVDSGDKNGSVDTAVTAVTDTISNLSAGASTSFANPADATSTTATGVNATDANVVATSATDPSLTAASSDPATSTASSSSADAATPSDASVVSASAP